MHQLDAVGIPMPVLCNGPSEGEPQYPVPCNIYERFIQEIEDTNEGQTGTSPRASLTLRALPISMPMLKIISMLVHIIKTLAEVKPKTFPSYLMVYLALSAI